MKKFFILLSLCLLAVCFGACQNDRQYSTLPLQQGTEESIPSMNNASTDPEPSFASTLVTELLEVPGDYSRCSVTSTSRFWEVESGFYYQTSEQMLYYADKTDLSNWIPVCSKPDCPHLAVGVGTECDARADRVLIKGDRIYKILENQSAFTLLSTALDGTDLRTEFVFTEASEFMGSHGGSAGAVITQGYLATYVSVLNSRGTYDFRVYTADENGVLLHMDEERENMSVLISNWDAGDGLWFNGTAIVDDRTRSVIFTLQNGELISVDLTGLPTVGSCFTGDELLAFRPNDGYYRIDTATREEVKLSEPRLADSNADIALPNCILESTMFYSEQTVEHHETWLFNGEQWLEVTVPEEFLIPDSDLYIVKNTAVASDRLLLLAATKDQRSDEPYRLYQILLGEENLAMEYLATIG